MLFSTLPDCHFALLPLCLIAILLATSYFAILFAACRHTLPTTNVAHQKKAVIRFQNFKLLQDSESMTEVGISIKIT